MGGNILTRRELLRNSVAVGGALSIPVLSGCGDERKITTQRQKILDDLVRDEPSPYARRIIYDHDGSLKSQAEYNQFRRILDDPQYLDYIIKYTDADNKKFGLTREDYNIFHNLPNFLRRPLFNFLNRETGKKQDGFTDFYHPDFGNGVQSDVYISGQAFERIYFGTKNGDIEIPEREKIRTILRHEHIHAENYFKGINLGNGLIINAANHFNIDPRVIRYVMEMEAHLGDVEFSKQQFGEGSSVYWYNALGLLSNSIQYYDTLIKNRKFTPYEQMLIDTQLSKVDRVSPDLIKTMEKFK